VAGNKKKINRSLFNFAWWLVQVTGWGLLNLLVIGDLGNSLPLLFWPFFATALMIQAFFHWLVLKRLYPDQRRRNVISVAAMPLFLFFGLWVALIIDTIISAASHGFK